MFNEVHRNRIPGFLRNRELLQKSIRLVPRCFGPFASSAGFTEILNEGSEIRPYIFLMNCFKGLVLLEMSSKNMVMFVLKDLKLEVQNVGTNIQLLS